MERQLLQRQERAGGSPAPVLRSPLYLRTVDSNDAELTGYEETVSEDEKQNGAKAENGFYVVSPLFNALEE